ncbi:hypothetical protein LTR17_016402 [Elasticomyces elasticus]|nr:hypothetical protein LTR17_016402 [Elasticomyces elasticus]
MAALPAAQSLRVLCLDGGGIKGYTSLLILKRIFRTMASEGELLEEPRPCDVFDLITGTSTGGLIAVMLGRLHMTIDECIAEYENVGKRIFGKRPAGGQVGKLFKGLTSSPFYDIGDLQDEIKSVLDEKDIPRSEPFLEAQIPRCKVMLCVTRKVTSKADVLRNYQSFHSTEENYHCQIWEAASATAAAPMYFKHVKFEGSGEKWCDGGIRRNNPVNEALAEITREKDWKDKELGCILSLGTGAPQIKAVSANLAAFLKGSVEIMTDSEDIADQFAVSKAGRELTQSKRYFRFSVPHGMAELEMEDYKETERMKGLTAAYLKGVGSGDQVEQCAKSLLYPDKNLQVQTTPNPYILPYNPSTHFVERSEYAEALHSFFTPHASDQQIFVLWGLGGVGKLDPEAVQTPDTDTNHPNHLRRILSKLEEASGRCLLILDNVDDLDEFLGRTNQELRISDFMPRSGRILITTRDKRFQGTIAGAQNGLRVLPMKTEEATKLLWRCMPAHLPNADPKNTTNTAAELLVELGNLPLAIAQAAANIVDRQPSLAEYVTLYREKRRRLGLMQVPVQDFQSNDPRNSSQSVLVTWELSFEHLQENSPLSATFLSYLGCFHWQRIPRQLLLKLPEFEHLDLEDIRQVIKRPLNLSLLDEIEETAGLVEYSVHPLVNERVISRLNEGEAVRYLTPCIYLLAGLFPRNITGDDQATHFLARYLVAHAVRQIELAEEFSVVSKSYASLLQVVAEFISGTGMVKYAVYLATRSLDLAMLVLNHDDLLVFRIRTAKASCLNNAARYSEAETECRFALELLDLREANAEVAEEDIDCNRNMLQGHWATALLGLRRFSEVEEVYRKQLLNRTVAGKAHEEVIIKHNLANVLGRQGKTAEAEKINDEVLAWSFTAEGKVVVPRSLVLVMMNLKAHIRKRYASSDSGLKDSLDEEVLETYLFVYHESLELLGIADINTWIAANNAIEELHTLQRYSEEGQILETILTASISAKVRVEGKFAVTFWNTYFRALQYRYAVRLDSGDAMEITSGFSELLLRACESVGINTDDIPPHQMTSALNVLAVEMQRQGEFTEAESNHRKALQMTSIEDFLPHTDGPRTELTDVIYYNIMLAIARQGRVAQAFAFREEHRTEVARAEQIHGALETRLEQDRTDFGTYKEAEIGLTRGSVVRGDAWWKSRGKTLVRAEMRYGRLEHNALFAQNPITEPTEPPDSTQKADESTSRKRGMNMFGKIRVRLMPPGTT